MTSIIKQFLINQLDIPTDLFDKIKGFCFYDKKSWETIQFIRYKKEVINDIFKNHAISRANPSDWFDDNDDEHWSFWVDTPEHTIRSQFQGANCMVCGNYIPEYAARYCPTSIQCECTWRYELWNDELWNDELWNDELWNDHDDE
jgi:hypothetical protein